MNEAITEVLKKYGIEIFSIEREDLFTFIITTDNVLPDKCLRELREAFSKSIVIHGRVERFGRHRHETSCLKYLCTCEKSLVQQ